MKEGKSNLLIQEWLESEGAYVFKTLATNRGGTHDIIGCLNGRFISIEGKKPKGQKYYLQELRIREIFAAGGFAMIAYTPQEVKDAIKEWREAGYKYDFTKKLRPVIKITI